MATIKDVAKDAGVSLGTVSKVLNGIHVSDDYRIRVEESIKKLHYHVNPNAHGLKAQKTNDIAVIVPTLMNALFPPMLDAIEKELNTCGKRMLICISRNDASKINSYVSTAAISRVDGIFGVTYSKIKDPSLSGVPMVSFDRHFNDKVPCIACDNEGGGYLAAKTLHKKGSKNLLCLWAGSDYDSEPIHRIDGFKKYCEENGIEHNVLSFMDYNQADTGFMYPSDNYKKLVHGVLSNNILSDGKFKYDGVFASSDHLAYILLNELRQNNVKVPEDVQIIGFDGMEDYITGVPVISSIRQPIEEIARTGIQILLKMIDGEKVKNVTNIPVNFVEGGTTRS
ncbi:LacI family DNA-binding transcriptional regulator [Butyrivibrio sp. NC3005]|uniref:LacI family DNA-binding transcriptional regulator n=1 Tax=Butyrivibrio sp. NC3005 TaxID=1280685 RepID=UPI0004135154|nr:LacI family DNA-binding transcriptional regulator [Butyrivibrio sp. NC3005]